MKNPVIAVLVTLALCFTGMQMLVPGGMPADWQPDAAARESSTPLAPSPPIRIDSDADFPAHAAAGDGSASSPWVLEYLDIEGAGTGYCLYIGNTTQHFTVRNCTLANATGGAGEPYFPDAGLVLFNTAFGRVENSTFNQNAGAGIYLNSSVQCSITGNDLVQNGMGMKLDAGCANNTMYHNNFLGNTVQARDDGLNTWNLSYPAGGNHWSDWTSPDADFDGFVDNIYAIPGSGESGDIPPGYYDSAAGKAGEELKSALHSIIRGHTRYTYDEVWDILKDTDEDPNNPNNVLLLYSGWSYPKSSNGGGVSDWNREHVWSKSHGFPSEGDIAYTDVHHLRPTDVTVNSARGSKDFDIGGSQYIDGDGPTDCYTDSDSWEPRDEVKGDVARMMFYMVVRYEGTDTSYDLELLDTVGTSGPYFGKLSRLLEWHEADPVSDWERNRNNKIYNNWQHNRNPFIDHPEYADAIWGSGDPPAPGSGGGSGRDYYPFAYQDGWDAPPGPVHNLDQGVSYHHIQWAVDNASTGDTILVDPGTYYENVVIDRTLSLVAGNGTVIIDGGGSGTVVSIQAVSAEIQGFTVRNGGSGQTDACIMVGGDLCRVRDNVLESAGVGLYIASGSDNATATGNTMTGCGTGALVQGSGCQIYHNNFLANTNHAADYGQNLWDMGYPTGGNFFDNWTSPDADLDGFVDQPFVLDGGSGGAACDHIVISELSSRGPNGGYDEFIELYNPTGQDVDVGGWAIEYMAASGSGGWQNRLLIPSSTVIPAHGFLLTANPHGDYSGPAPDIWWDTTVGISDDGHVRLNSDPGVTDTIVDKVGWGSAIDPEGGTAAPSRGGTNDAKSLERKASASSTEASMGPGGGEELAGNGQDTDVNGDDFLIRTTREPQGLSSPLETAGGGGNRSRDNWPFAQQDGWLSADFSMPLDVGWNLISLPLLQSNYSLGAVLASVSGGWDRINMYRQGIDYWTSTVAGRPDSLNEITSMDIMHGFWLHVNRSNAFLNISGAMPGTVSIDLYAGWNLVGYPSMTSLLASDVLPPEADMVAVYDGAQSYLIRDVADLSTVTMQPGQGYWVHVTADTTWVVDW